MQSLDKLDLIDVYYPSDELIEVLLIVPREEREAVLRASLAGATEEQKDRRIPRLLAMIDACARRD